MGGGGGGGRGPSQKSVWSTAADLDILNNMPEKAKGKHTIVLHVVGIGVIFRKLTFKINKKRSEHVRNEINNTKRNRAMLRFLNLCFSCLLNCEVLSLQYDIGKATWPSVVPFWPRIGGLPFLLKSTT